MIGETLGSYKVLAELGAGGMGAVYTAEHTLIGRKAAVKLLLPNLSSNKELVDRFFNEARAAALIKHPGIVDIFDFGYADNGSAYIIMELLEGESLADRMDRGPMAEEQVIRLARQVAATLADVHRAEIIHRDLKPDNIFLVPDSEVPGGERSKVLDFGIAKLSGQQAPGTAKTRTGQMMGSPLYMSPEQCRGAGEVDLRADIYSLGCIMYEMLSGQPVFNAEGVGEVIAKHIYEPPTALRKRKPEVSESLEAVIMRTLAKDADERFASMQELVEALDELRAGAAADAAKEHPVVDEDSVAETMLPGDDAVLPKASDPKVLTTLGTAAAEMAVSEPLPATRQSAARGRTIGIAVVLLAAGGVAYGLYGQRGGADRGPAASATPAPVAASAEPSAEPAEPSAEPTASPASKITIRLESRPSHAEVVRPSSGDVLGHTPYETEIEQGEGDWTVELRLDGHVAKRVDVPRSEDFERVVALTRRPPSMPGAIVRPPVLTTPPTPATTAPPAPTPEPPAPEPKPTPEEKKKDWGKTYNPLDG